MSRRILFTIIILTSVSLIAALITQLLWVQDAWNLKKDQFTNKVEIAMKSVVNQLLTSDYDSPANPSDYDTAFYREHQQFLLSVNPKLLDSLLGAEISSMHLNRSYIYAVYRESDSSFIMGDYKGNEQMLFSSNLQVSLSCLCEEQNYILTVYFPQKQKMILSNMIILPVMSGIFLLVLVFSFFFTIYSMLRQKKLSEMKNDFVNNMTHEFKTPISTISVSSEMLMTDQVINSPDKIEKYARIILDENNRLKNQVEHILQLAIFDKGELNLKLRELDVHEVINECVKNFKVVITDSNGKLTTSLKALNSKVLADKAHLTNVINNLIDNAVKYSLENPEILITTINVRDSVIISVSDHGIGIRKENQKEIFKKFHRLQTGDIHDVNGFGIGLFYVKSILENMGAIIDVESELNKGTTFTINFPQKL